MRSEFEKTKTYGLCKSLQIDFDEDRKRYYSINPDLHVDVMSINSAFCMFQEQQPKVDELQSMFVEQARTASNQQAKIDELQKQRDSFIKAYEIEIDKSDELQKENSALVHVIKSRDIQLENEKHEYDELMNKLVDSGMKNKELQKQLIDQGQRFNEQAQRVKDLEHKNGELQKRVDELEFQLKDWKQKSMPAMLNGMCGHCGKEPLQGIVSDKEDYALLHCFSCGANKYEWIGEQALKVGSDASN